MRPQSSIWAAIRRRGTTATASSTRSPMRQRAASWRAGCGRASGSRSCRPTAPSFSPLSRHHAGRPRRRAGQLEAAGRRRRGDPARLRREAGAVRRGAPGAVPGRSAGFRVRRRFRGPHRSGAIPRGRARSRRPGDVSLHLGIERAAERGCAVAPEPSLGHRDAPPRQRISRPTARWSRRRSTT